MERELLILGLLRQHDMHGYQLIETITRDMAACIDLKKPTAYYLLDKMADNGWVTKTTEKNSNRPARHVFTITQDGEAAFQRILRDNLGSYAPSNFSGDIGIGFMDELPTQEAISLLRQRRAQMQISLDQMADIPAHPGSQQFMIEHLHHHLAAEVHWLDSVITRVEAKQRAQQAHS